MTDNSIKNDINREDNISITTQLTNMKNKFDEEFNNESSKITKLINYIEKLSLEFNQLYLNFYDNKQKLNSSNENNIVNNYSDSFYIFHNKFFERFKNISDIINKDISPSLKKTKKIYEKEIKKNLSALVDIIDQINLHQNVLNIIKNEYYDECKKLENMEQENKKENSSNTNDEIMQKMANQTKYMENKFSLYKKEVEVMKKLCSDCERDFKNIKQKLQENEIQKNNNIHTIIRNYLVFFIDDIKIIKDEVDIFQNFLNQNKSQLNNSQLINKIFENDILWKYDFDITKSNNINKFENKEEKNEINIKEEEEEEKEEIKGPIKFEELIIMPKNNYDIEGIDINYMELNKSNYELIKKDEDEATKKFSSELLKIKDFFKTLFSTDIIESEQKNILMNILEKYQGNVNCYIKFCDKFLFSNKDCKQEIFEFQSFSNLAYFSGLLKNIIENISDNLLSNDINSYKLFDKIICIGEKSMYKDTYLCELLSSENQIFKKDIIWKNGLKNKLINLFDDICKKEYNQEKTKEGNYLKKGFGAFGKLFQKRDSLTKVKKNILIETYGLDKQIKIYKELNKQALKRINDNYGLNVIHEIIKCYIRHMINYNYLNKSEKNNSELEEIFNQILNDFSIKDNNRFEIHFLNLYFHSNIHSIKKPKDTSKIKLLNNIGYNSPNEKNILIIKKLSKYLNSKEKINLLNLNHQYINLDKYIYHRFLKKDENFNSKNRIGIWKILLNFKESLKKYDYKKIIEELNKVPIDEKEGNDYLIMMDIKRTRFKLKENDGKKILFNLLRSLFYDNKNEQIIYCQGMNFIAAIFYDIVQNEEETFHLLKGFFTNGKYQNIFKNRLSLLKQYFIIFEKLIYLFLPKIHEKLLTNKIQANLFVSPYFVTLFTNIYAFHPDNANKFLLHCLDDFILNGWCSFFSTLICVLKYFERKILDLKAEELIKFLVNDIGKSDLFIDNNYEMFYKLKKQYWISNDLLGKLYEEIQVEKEIKSQFGETE